MTYKIFKGWHRCFPPALWLYFNKKVLKWKVCFDNTTRYNIGKNQFDINKLCGIGYFPSLHKNSARFGWRWDMRREQIELLAYCYDNGVRLSSASTEKHLSYLDLNNHYDLMLKVNADCYQFTVQHDGRVIGYQEIKKTNTRKWGFKCNPYFGGDQTAPYTMCIKLN